MNCCARLASRVDADEHNAAGPVQLFLIAEYLGLEHAPDLNVGLAAPPLGRWRAAAYMLTRTDGPDEHRTHRGHGAAS